MPLNISSFWGNYQRIVGLIVMDFDGFKGRFAFFARKITHVLCGRFFPKENHEILNVIPPNQLLQTASKSISLQQFLIQIQLNLKNPLCKIIV